MFDVRHPFRGLEGGIMELAGMAHGMDVAAPHAAREDGSSLKQRLTGIPPLDSGHPSMAVTDRLARAHHHAREILKTAAQLTDAYFHFTPAQIWLSALLIVDPPLAQFYLDSKFPPPSPSPSPQAAEIHIMTSAFREKVEQTLASCRQVLQSYHSLSNDPVQMQNLKRIAKKLYHCQNPDKVNLHKGNAYNSSPGSGPEGNNHDVTDRAVKKRRLDQGSDEL